MLEDPGNDGKMKIIFSAKRTDSIHVHEEEMFRRVGPVVIGTRESQLRKH